ncbi:hypothetical protein CASFOL_011407 [Castilleja foliolosa]|uniref:Ty3 transposon capsid-like protein domain-containing protein n=1 Tax=Castilleja foliolosa TaxID=1961234 RepID=A0ABD3DVZ9_9LAMI
MGAPTNTARIEALERALGSTASQSDIQRLEDKFTQQMADLRELILATDRRNSQPSPIIPDRTDFPAPGMDERPEWSAEGSSAAAQMRMVPPRMEFPKFDGTDARGWIRRCQRYFSLNPLSDDTKIMLAGMNLEGMAEYWFLDHVEGRNLSWSRFVDLFIYRFTSVRDDDVIGEFNKLKQLSTVEKYIEKFVELRSYMLYRNGHLDENYFLKSFFSGLKEDIRHMVELLSPNNLEQAYMMARKQEVVLDTWHKSGKLVHKAAPTWQRETKQSDSSKRESVGMSPAVAVKRLSREQMDERRRRGLCFNCDESYSFGHRCKKLFVIMLGEDKEIEEISSDHLEDESDCGVSLHALKGQVPTDTIKLAGKVGNNSLVILVDSGSTHSFIDPSAAKRVNCDIEVTNPMQVTVAGGGQIECSSKCPNLQWEMAGHIFSAGVRILPLGGYDIE